MACTTCLKDWISCGNDALIVQGTLLPETGYEWLITTPMGSKYSGIANTDTEGKLTIDTGDLPDGLLNPYAGLFTLEVPGEIFNNSAYCESYTCIEFEVKNGNAIKNALGETCDLL